MSKLFDPTEKNTSDRYREFRDHPLSDHQRDLLERLWVRFKPFADPHFLEEFYLQFDKRVWEMHLAVSLMEHGHSISSDHIGPDIQIDSHQPNVWVEAISAGRGDGPDAPADLSERDAGGWIQDEPIILRFRNAIESKQSKYVSYCESEIISKNEPYVIALNGSEVPLSFIDTDLPRILSCVLPIGKKQHRFDPNDPKSGYMQIAYLDKVVKASGSEVETDLFMRAEYSGISAILFSNRNAENLQEPLGRDFIVVRNHTAKNPIPKGFLPAGFEWWMDGNELAREVYK